MNFLFPKFQLITARIFLSILIEEFGDTKTALAAYHAGRGIVNEWLDDERYSYDGKILDNIPYKDTEAYTKQVLKVRERYCDLYKLENTASTDTVRGSAERIQLERRWRKLTEAWASRGSEGPCSTAGRQRLPSARCGTN